MATSPESNSLKPNSDKDNNNINKMNSGIT